MELLRLSTLRTLYVFRRRLKKQRREMYPERYARGEVETLLQELKQLGGEEMARLEEVRPTQWKCDIEEWEASVREEPGHIREETDMYFSSTILRDSLSVSHTKSDLDRKERIRRAEARKARKAKAERKARKSKSRMAKREEVRIHMPLIDRRWGRPAVPVEDVAWEEKKDCPEWWIPELERLTPAFGLELEEVVSFGFEEVGTTYQAVDER